MCINSKHFNHVWQFHVCMLGGFLAFHVREWSWWGTKIHTIIAVRKNDVWSPFSLVIWPHKRLPKHFAKRTDEINFLPPSSPSPTICFWRAACQTSEKARERSVIVSVVACLQEEMHEGRWGGLLTDCSELEVRGRGDERTILTWIHQQ